MDSWWRRRAISVRPCLAVVPLLLVFGAVISLWDGSSSSSSNLLQEGTTLSAEGTTVDARSNVVAELEDPLSMHRPDLSGSETETETAAFNTTVAVSPSPAETEKQEIQQQEILENATMNNSGVYNNLLNSSQSISSPLNPRIRKFSSLEVLEEKLHRARSAIREAAKANDQLLDPDYTPTGPMYWNPKAFHRSYLEMEKQFKIYVYEEGEPPIFHNGPCGSIYSMEGNFIHSMESSKFRTRDIDKAHMFFLPISMTSIVHFIYDRTHKSKDHWRPLKDTVKGYIDLVSTKYPYWNRSTGADHFILACHDWGPELSKSVPELFKNSIRALCNANTSEGFNPSKDVSIPEINLPGRTIKGLIGGPSPSKRSILAFFAGGVHGPIRPLLLEHWENKDQDIQVHKYLPKGVSYYGMLKQSRFCLCPSGYEVASPRMVEALYSGCVPVIIKDHYVAPFSDVLNWKSFSVEVPVSEIPNLKAILSAISSRQYIRLQRRGKLVRKHFELNWPPKRYDVFHMILHSIWLRRLNIRLNGVQNL